MRKILPGVIAPLLMLLAVAGLVLGCSSTETVGVSFSGSDGKPVASFRAELAATPSAREIGLMYRKELPDDHGMLFIFPTEIERSFWMKNTYIELDMIFVSAANKVVSIVERAVPLTESARVSNGPSLYVLEVKGGRSKALGIQAGMTMTVDGKLPPSS